MNDLMEAYAPKTQSRKRFRTGNEFTPTLQHTRVRKGKSECLACQGLRLGQRRSRRSRAALSQLAVIVEGRRSHDVGVKNVIKLYVDLVIAGTFGIAKVRRE